eukprot:Lithocolla_globosa_v1_NODE_3661_length_1610_cov_26.740360.p1 type:complete len:461 gc:universal NODE_3661_length_1610_cov_26.740360:67-1449(+)
MPGAWAHLPDDPEEYGEEELVYNRPDSVNSRAAMLHAAGDSYYDVDHQIEVVRPFKLVDERHGTVGSSYLNLGNTVLGSGMLSLPDAIRVCGVILGPLVIIIASIFSAFAFKFTFEVADLCNGRASYHSITHMSMPRAKFFVDFVVFVKCFGVSVTYLVVIGDSMTLVARYFLGEDDGSEASDVFWSNRNFWILGAAFFIAPLCYLKELDSLKYSSGVASFGILYVLLLVIAYHWIEEPYEGPINYFRLDAEFFEVMTVYVFLFSSLHVSFTIHTELKDPTPTRLMHAVHLALGTSIVIYFCMGLFGYLTYGEETCSNILNCLPATLPPTIGRVAITIVVAFSIPLQINPARLCADGMYVEIVRFLGFHPSENITKYRYYGLTTLTLIGAWTLGLIFDDLRVVLGLVGAIGSTSVTYILPPIFYLLLFRNHRFSFFKLVAIIMVCIGVLVMPTAVIFIFL